MIPRNVIRHCIRLLYSTVRHCSTAAGGGWEAGVVRAYSSWRALHTLTTSIGDDGWRAVERMAREMGAVVGSENDLWLFLFSIETQLHLLIRLLTLARLGAAVSSAEDAGREISRRRGLFPPSPLEWPLDTISSREAPDNHRRTLQSIVGLTAGVAGGMGGAAADMFRELYQGVLPREVRRSLGEFYTSEDLVREVLNAVDLSCTAIRKLYSEWRETGEPQHIVDPACGSGAFLVEVVRRIYECLGCEPDVERFIEDVLVGIDINPLAVEMARLNLVLAISSCLSRRCGRSYEPRSLKILWADSLAVCRERRSVVGMSMVDVDVPVLRQWLKMGALSIPAAPGLPADRVIELAASCADSGGDGLEHLCEVLGRAGVPRRAAEQLYTAISTITRLGGARAAELIKGSTAVAQLTGRCAYVVGNPPWIRIQRIAPEIAGALRERYRYFRSGSTYNPRYARTVIPFTELHDYSLAFVERGLEMLRGGGALGFVITSKIVRTLYAGGLREDLVKNFRILRLTDYSLHPVPLFEDAVNYPLILAVRRERPGEDHEVEVEVVNTAGERRSFRVLQRELPMDVGDPRSPWILAPPEVVSVYRRIARRCPRLGDVYAVRTGVMLGADDIYVVRVAGCRDGLAEAVGRDGRRFLVEPGLLHLFVRGRDIDPFRCDPVDYVLFAHSTSGSFEPLWDPDQREVLRALGLLSDRVGVEVDGQSLVYRVGRGLVARALGLGRLLAGLGYTIRGVSPCAVDRCFEVLRGGELVLRVGIDAGGGRVFVEGLRIPGAPHATRYLLSNLHRLVARDGYRASLPPWAVLRVSQDKFEDFRIAWQEIARRFEACIPPVNLSVEICGEQVPRKLVLNMKVYFIAERSRHRALRLLLYLNSELARSLLKLRAWSDRGGFYEHNAASVGFLPLPRELLEGRLWSRVDEVLQHTSSSLNEAARRVREEMGGELERELAELLNLSEREWMALVSWGRWLNEDGG